MEHLKSQLRNIVEEVMDTEQSGMEHFRLFWEGELKVSREKAISYIREHSEELDVMPIFREEEGKFKVSFLPENEQKESKIWVNIILLIVTFLTTLAAGAFQQGINFITNPAGLIQGLPFSLSIMIILGCHELGHYRAAKKNNVDATLPYFIPFPHIIGTLGAVIKMKSPITDRNSLVEIGAAGPITGFILATVALLIGLSLSETVPIQYGGTLQLGDSLLINLLSKIFFSGLPPGKEVMLHPIAFAGWIGYFVTALNLIPIGQLDGGHIVYALFGKKHKIAAYISFAVLIGMSFLWLGWLIWGVFVFLVIGFEHPPPLDNISQISKRNRIIGYISLAIFILTFIPNPFQLI